MIAQRVGVAAVRRAARPNVFFNPALPRALVASSLSATQTRSVATEKLSISANHDLLAKQRLRRPVSPHLEIYDKSQTWFGASAWHRITGASLSGGFYVFAAAYVAAPLLGWHLESASLAAAFGGMAPALKGGIKFLVAWPFTFHAFQGVRHVIMDMGYMYVKRHLLAQGWTVWGLSLVSALYLAFGL